MRERRVIVSKMTQLKKRDVFNYFTMNELSIIL